MQVPFADSVYDCSGYAGSCLLFYVFLQNSTTLSLHLRYWDLSIGQYKVLELQCPHQTARETPAPVTVALLPTPPSTTHVSPPVVPKPKVLCSSHHMTVEIPTAAISAIYVKGLCLNMLSVYVQGHIWLPSALLELNFNNVVQGPCWCLVKGGRGGGGGV